MSLRDIEIAQGELAKALNSIELEQMVGWLATQYQRLAAKVERDGQYAASRPNAGHELTIYPTEPWSPVALLAATLAPAVV